MPKRHCCYCGRDVLRSFASRREPSAATPDDRIRACHYRAYVGIRSTSTALYLCNTHRSTKRPAIPKQGGAFDEDAFLFLLPFPLPYPRHRHSDSRQHYPDLQASSPKSAIKHARLRFCRQTRAHGCGGHRLPQQLWWRLHQCAGCCTHAAITGEKLDG